MDLPNPDHALYRDFQDVRLHFHTTLVFQGGTGGHFLSGLLGGSWNYHNPQTNEYDSDNCMWLHLDTESVDVDTNQAIVNNPDLDRLYGIAQGIAADAATYSSCGLAMGHESPYITSQVMDFRTKELIVLNVSEADIWLAEALRWYKHAFSSDFSEKRWMIPFIMRHNRYQEPIVTAEYERMCRVLNQHTQQRVAGTLLSWRYFLDSKADGRDPCDLEVFYAYISHHWLQDRTWKIFNCDELRDRRTRCSERAQLFTEVDYRQLFFKLSVPAQGWLSTVDKWQVLKYSWRNIDILRRMSLLATAHEQQLMQDRIAVLETQLKAAAAAL